MASDVEQWLTSLDLAKYASIFVENEVALRDLPQITEDDLKELGLPLGPRKRVMAAIQGLEADAAHTETSGVEAEAQGAEKEAERRQVTVLFADISGFTALSERLGSEATHALLNDYFAVADAAVVNLGGTVDKHIGDAVMAVFGAPMAHTDDPERAARAAMELHRVAAAMQPTLAIHVGIASGQVVASSMGSESYSEYTVTGDSVNLAARLTDLAQSGETLASAAVARSLAGRVASNSLGQRTIQGLAEPIEVWRLDGITGDMVGAETPFVGRDKEQQMFLDAVDSSVATGVGDTILVRGEAGIGKSRLLQEFDRLVKGRGFSVYSGSVLDFGAGKGQDAIGGLVRSLLGASPEIGNTDLVEIADQAIASGLLSNDSRVHLNNLLDLPQIGPLRAVFEALDNDARSRGRQDTLDDLVRSRAKQGPVLIRIEDLHWADAAVLEHAAALARTVSEQLAVLVLTSRIEGDPFDRTWLGKAAPAEVRSIDLGPLETTNASELAHQFFSVEEGIIAKCVERAAGNPLFLEQLLRNAEELAEDNIPGTVQGIVQARLDAIPALDRRALQAASVLGQRFTLAAVHEIADLADYRPDKLLAATLIRQESGGYLFGHALIRDGVYASLLTARRQELHKAAASWFSDRDTLLYAHHLDRADDPERAAAYFAAGRELTAEFRYDDALVAVERGIEIAEAGPVTFDLASLRGDVLLATGDTQASIEAFAGAVDMAPDNASRCRALIGIVAGQRVLGQVDGVLAVLDEAQSLAETESMSLELARIHHMRGNVAFVQGNVALCDAEQQLSLDHARAAGSAEIEAQAYSGLADAYYMQGRMITSFRNYERAIEVGREHDLLAVQAGSIPAIAHGYLFQNRFDDLHGLISDGMALIQQVGHLRAEAIFRINCGGIFCEFLDPAVALEASAKSAEIFDRIGAKIWEPLTLILRARSLEQLGDADGALTAARRGAELASETSRALLGPWNMGVLALISEDPTERRLALDTGDEMVADGVVGHCQLWFYRDAIEACLRAGDLDGVDRYVGLLEEFTAPEPLPWSDFFIARGRALAAHARSPDKPEVRDRLRELLQTAATIKMGTAIPAIEQALGKA